jgi:hypothetical protein
MAQSARTGEKARQLPQNDGGQKMKRSFIALGRHQSSMNKTEAVGKYGNRQSVASNGKVLSSKRECRRYEELLLMQKMGLIKNLQTQVKYELIPKQKGERAVTYTADFVYQNAHLHVEDAKGCKTQQYVIRRKLMLWIHQIKVEEV